VNPTVHYVDEIVGSDAPHVPAGSYLARLDGIEAITTKFGAAYRWHWIVVDPEDGSDFEVTQLTSTATSGGSNAGRNIRALLGRGLAGGEKLSTSLVEGQYATLVLTVDPDSGWNKVADAVSAPRPTAQAGSAQAMLDRITAEEAAPRDGLRF
jgi:hypothetical protein